MKIVMASSELAPFAETGSLGENVRTLSAELRKAGHDVSVVLPYYRSVREGNFDAQGTGVEFQVNLGGKRATAEILQTRSSDGLQVFLVRRDEYFDRSSLYGDGRAYEDNAERFIFFSKAVLELSRRLSPTPEIIHGHDWATALMPVFAKERELPFRTVLTIHTLEHQGSFWSFDFALTNLPGHYFNANGVEFYGRLNFLKAGILYADAVALAGEPALHDAFTPEGGHGLHLVLQENAARAHGIPAGNDYALSNPPVDGFSADRPGADFLEKKRAHRARFATAHKLRLRRDDLLVALPASAGEGAALSPVLPNLDLLLTGFFRLAYLGPVAVGQQAAAIVAARRYPDAFVALDVAPGTAERAAALAAADLALFPAGLGRGEDAVAALRYGTVPVARFRPGVSQLVTDASPTEDVGTGFLYYRPEPAAVWDALQRAAWYRARTEDWERLVRRAVAVDFSWTRCAGAYAALYASLVRHRGAVSA